MKKIGQSGDTIIEVVLAITVISVILGGSVVLVNRNTRSLQATQEHSAGTRIAQSQLEALRAYAGSNADELKGSTGPLHAATGFCMKLNTSEPVAISPTETACKVNSAGAPTTDDPAYNIVITVTKHTLDGVTSYDAKVRVTWDSLTNHQDQVTLTYRTYDKLTPTIGADLFCAPDEQGTWPNCEPRTCDPETEIGTWPDCTKKPLPPRAVAISPASVTFPAIHLAYATGPTRNFTVTVPANSGPTALGAVSLNSTTNFQITSDLCSNKTLNGGQSCVVTVRFLPPVGPAHNIYTNAGTKTATLTVRQTGFPNKTASLSGKAVSNILVSGNVLRAGDSIRSYSNSCINNAEACGYYLIVQNDGNVVIYNSATNPDTAVWSTGTTGYTGVRMAMQTDGHLVVYNGANTALWWSNMLGIPLGPGNIAILQHTPPQIPNFSMFNVGGAFIGNIWY